MRLVACLLLIALPAFPQLLTDDSHLIAQGFDSAPGTRQQNDFFGVEMIGGDFNGDGYSDLAVAGTGDPNGRDRGTVIVFPGGPSGVMPEQAVEFVQGAGGLDGNDENSDNFGFSLAAGDFDNDGYWDLAIGVPGEDGARGVVQVLYGTPNGLDGSRDQVWDQDPLEGSGRDTNDVFGFSVAVGDFNDDGFDDLAVGSPGESNAGGVLHAIYGSRSGLTASGNQSWRQDADGIQGNREQFDRFGDALATGDFNGDGSDDLAVGVPGEDGGDGGCQIIFGSRGGGLRSDGNLFFKQGRDGVPDDDENEDRWCSFLTAGDFNADGFDDLAVSSINEDSERGIVIVLPGSSGGPTSSGSVAWRQGESGLQDEREGGDRFGSALIAGDFNADGYEDLAIGVRGEDGNRGIVQVIYGSSSGLDVQGNQLFQEGFEGMAGEARSSDDFGFALAAGNFGFDAAQDLAVGAPNEENGEGRGTSIPDLRLRAQRRGRGPERPLRHRSLLQLHPVGLRAELRPRGYGRARRARQRSARDERRRCLRRDGRPAHRASSRHSRGRSTSRPMSRRISARSSPPSISNCDTPNERRSSADPADGQRRVAGVLLLHGNEQRGRGHREQHRRAVRISRSASPAQLCDVLKSAMS